MIPRLLVGALILLIFLTGINLAAQDAPESSWQQAIPVARFGYGRLLSVYWSPVTGQLAASSERGLQYYNAELQLEAERRFGNVPNQGAIFSPDMHFVALQEANGLIIRDTRTWEPVLALNTFAAPSWSPDSKLLATWSNGVLQIWDVNQGILRQELPQLISNDAPVQWSPDGQVIAVPAGATIVMVNARTGDIVRIHDFYRIVDFEWSRDGRWFVIVGQPEPPPLDYAHRLTANSLIRLDAVTGQVVMSYPLGRETILGNAVYSVDSYVSISPDGRYISARVVRAKTLDENQWQSLGMSVFDLETGKRATTENGAAPFSYDVTYTSWSPDSKRFATSTGSSLLIYDLAAGRQVADLPAYIAATGQTVWTENGQGLIAAGGLWDVQGDFPQYRYPKSAPTPAQDRYVPPHKPTCTLQNRQTCPPFMVPDPIVFDYHRPPYDWKLLHWFADRTLAISYEIDIEYPDTPEYEDDEPPEERYILWDIMTGERMDKRVYLGGQTAWVYDLDDVPAIETESRAFNIKRNTRFIVIGDDEIGDLRNPEVLPLEGVNRWEWREVWFSPDGSLIYAYDTDGRFKTFDPKTGKHLYTTVPAPRQSLWYTADLTLTLLQDGMGTLYIYKTATGELILETNTANQSPLLLWNADRTQLAIGGENRAIIIFDVATQERLGTLRGHQRGIMSMSWNPTCEYDHMETCRYVLASSDANGQVILWGLERRVQLVQTMPEAPMPPIYDLPVAEIDFGSLSPLWSYVTYSDNYGAPQAQTVRWTEAGIRINNDTYYTPNLSELADIPRDALWIQPEDVASDGRMIVSNGTVLDKNGQPLTQVVSSNVVDAMFDPAGERILTAEQTGGRNTLSGWVREYSAASGQFIRYWGGGNPGFDHITYSPNEKWIATTTIPYYNAGARVQVWFADRFNTQYSSLIGHSQRITALYWTGDEVITSSLDGSVRRWNIHTGWALGRWNHPEGSAITQMNWRDTNTLLVSAGDNLYLLDAQTLELRRTYDAVGGGSFDFSPDKTSVTVIGRDSIVRVVDLDSATITAEATRHMPAITHLQWQPSGEALAVARADGSLVLLDGRSGILTAILRPYGDALRSIAWNPDGTKLLLDVIDGPIQILNGKDGSLVSEINDPWRRAGVWWSPDGAQIAYGTYPNPDVSVRHAPSLVHIYTVDGTLLQSFDLNWADYIFYWQKKPFILSWSDDGTHLAAFYENGVRVWNTVNGQMIADHRDTLNLTDPDRQRYPNGRPPTDPRISLTLWDGPLLHFWRSDSAWQLNVADDDLMQLSATGLPLGTKRRADGKVLLADSLILHISSSYNLQNIAQSYVAADWHPTCWTTDCPAVLAVAHGSTITLLGYPEPAAVTAEAHP